MKLQGKVSADLVGLNIKRNNGNDGREAAVDVELTVDEEEAEAKWGEDFHTLAFSTMRTMTVETEEDGSESETIKFLVDSIPPGKAVVFERHQLEIEGERIDVQPRLVRIRTVDGAAKVKATLRLPIDVGRSKLLSALSGKVGKTIPLTFNPTQAGFEFHRKSETAPAEAVQ